ncbi:hypothetical protein ACIRG5_45555 [Lentzea sp. NPDC102401]|uniref:hypothetical protein n=1 Tax=Lentzea sp. NPDC102401 TaxID=3364128 RepID=UPI00380DC15D
MSDDAPELGLSAQEIHTWTQLVIGLATVSSLARRHLERARLERLAFADAEHAARMYEQSLHPPLRQMNAEEQQAWQRRVPRELAGPQPGESVTVWTAWMADAQGAPTGEWGVEAHSWGRDGAATSSLWVVCRDAEDAIGMQAYLRKFGTAEDLGRLRYLAGAGQGQFVVSPSVDAPEVVRRPRSAPVARPVDRNIIMQFEAALRALLPAHAGSVLYPDLVSDEHDAAKELRRLVHDEVRQSGVTPYALAKIVATVPRWNASEGVRNAPALAIWAIKRVRSSSGYERFAEQSARSDSAPAAEPSTPRESAEEQSTTALRLREVRTAAQARRWAEHLDPRNTEHQIEAKQGFGEWPEVDGLLAAKFPSLVSHALAAAKKEQDKKAAVVVAAEEVAVGSAALGDDAAVATVDDSEVHTSEQSAYKRAEMAEWVDTLDPRKGMDRTLARSTLGRSGVEIDRRLAAKFGMADHETATKKAKDDDAFAIRLTELYPDGLPDPTAEAEAGAWRGRAEGDEQQAAAHLASPDDRHTPVREDVTGAEQAATDHAVAAVHRGIGATVATRPAVPRQAIAARPPATR